MRDQLMPQEVREKVPKLYTTENVRLPDKIIAVKMFHAFGAGTWYIFEGSAYDAEGTEYDLSEVPKDAEVETLLFGLVTGLGEDEMGNISLDELASIEGKMFGRVVPGLPAIERDEHFAPRTMAEAAKTVPEIKRYLERLGY